MDGPVRNLGRRGPGSYSPADDGGKAAETPFWRCKIMVSPIVTPGKCKVDGKVVSTWEQLSLIWADVCRLLGRQYEGPQDDRLIISRLQELGIAPRWIDDEGTEIKAGVYGWSALSPEWPA